MLLLGAFAGLALLLAAVGIYSVLSYSVKRSVREIGIRLALGAQLATSCARSCMRDEANLDRRRNRNCRSSGAWGVFSSLIFDVRPTDPLTFLAVAMLLVAVALVASIVPAYRATKVDPMVALRYE